ncbi:MULTISPECIES: helix-turn-helix domain-containing protein [Hyphomicrobiales]|uniref:Transcriptional regulator n=1 Tax=Phreatobacter cathodiphilus TaxID=1868589 RepID=A0A2S0NFY3_9HYPH|nr:helix-turn-helix transcriptional regulator [Phreatobacter cathodiphilus]AVO47065.1 transcriptional regulator [Phreatobacter cathodiphilus]
MDGAAIVAWNLRRLRVPRGLSQEALAVDAGLDRSYIGRLERAVENPTVQTLDKLAATLSVRLIDLVMEPGAMRNAFIPMLK